jgi:hypothetical protein
MIPRAMLAVAYATGRASNARQVKSDDPDKKGYPGPPGWGLDVRLTTPPVKKILLRNLKKRLRPTQGCRADDDDDDDDLDYHITRVKEKLRRKASRSNQSSQTGGQTRRFGHTDGKNRFVANYAKNGYSTNSLHHTGSFTIN